MTIQDLIKLSESNWETRKALLLEKGASYSGPESEDTLSNFKRQALLKRTTPEDILLTYLLKHIDAIVSWVAFKQESEPIDGRLDDAQNYLDLLRGLIKEENQRKEPALRMAALQGQYNPND